MPFARYLCCLSLLALLGCNRPVVNDQPQRIAFSTSPDDPKELRAQTEHTGFTTVAVIGSLDDQQIDPKTITWIENYSQNSQKTLAMSIGQLTSNGFWIAYIYSSVDIEFATKSEQAKTTQQSPESHRLPPGAYGLRLGLDESKRLRILEIKNEEGRSFTKEVSGF